jgi:hypothetical protein
MRYILVFGLGMLCMSLIVKSGIAASWIVEGLCK